MNKQLDTLCQLLEFAHANGADCADGILVDSVNHSAAHRMGKPEDIERSESKAVGLRVFCGKRQAIVASTDLKKPALEELALRAITIARVATEDADSTLAARELYPQTIPTLDLEDNFVPDAAWLKEQARIAEDAARAVKGISNSEGAEAYYNHSTQHLAAMNNSINFAHSYSKSVFSLSASVLAGEGTGMERDYGFSTARHHTDLRSADSIGTEAGRRALRRLNPQKITTTNLPVLFDPRTSRSLLGVLASAISGGAIARGTSFLKNKMDAPIFTPAITIYDDALMTRGLASKPFDAEGVATRKHTLVENGILKSWLLDVRTANKLDLMSTGHASRGLSSAPSPSATNLYMENGNVSPEELMKDIKQGVYITETFGMGINTVTGDYSQGASGMMIEDGEITHPISEFTIAGNLNEMFMGATPANDLEFLYSSNAPTLRIEKMMVAGA